MTTARGPIQMRPYSNEKLARSRRTPRQMPLNWRVWPLLPVALLLTVSGIVPQTIAAQLSRPDFNEDLDFDSGSQAFPDPHWDICLSRHQIREINGRLGYQISLAGSPNLDAPGFDGIDRSGLEEPDPTLFNCG